MRNRHILLLGVGFTGALLFAIGLIATDASPDPARSSPAPDPGYAQADPGQFGWFPAYVPEGDAEKHSESAEIAGPGEAGMWSLPAEFAPPE